MYSIVSGIIFAITFIYPEISIITMGSFLIPLNSIKIKSPEGFVWGLIVFTSYWWWLAVLLMQQKAGVMGWMFYIILILWCSILSSIWIYFFKKYPINSTMIFFLVITQYCLIFAGLMEGMPFCNPLVFLAEYPILLIPLPWIGDIGMLLILFGIQIWIGQKKNIKMLISYFGMLLFSQCLLFSLKEDYLYTLKDAIIIIPWWYKKGDAMFCGYRLSHDICKAVSKDSSSKIILTPESTFCFDIEEYKSFIPIWCESANNIPILLAGHCFKKNIAHNGIFLLHNNKVVYSYFKQHKMPLIEKSLWFEKIISLPLLTKEIVLQGRHEENQKDLLVINNQNYQIFMCSEFFFESKKVVGHPILLLWNDTWLCCDYAKKLAVLFIKYFERKYNVHVYHVATSGLRNIT